MPVRNKTQKLKIPPIWETLSRIQSTLALNDQAMAELMRLTYSEFSNLKYKNIEPVVSSTMALTEAVNIGFDPLVTGKIDFSALDQHFRGNKSYLPGRYSDTAFTRKRVAINILDYIEQNMGWKKRAQVLRNFQLNEAVFSDPDGLVNLRLSVDIINWVHKECKSEEMLTNFGSQIMRSQRNMPIMNEVGKSRNLHELCEMMMTGGVLERYLEKNFSWNIHSMNHSQITLRGKPNPELILLGDDCIKSHAGCLVRKGVFSAFPTFLGYSCGKIHKTACLCNGDQFCEFQLDFESVLKSKKTTPYLIKTSPMLLEQH